MVYSGKFRPVLREDFERSVRDILVFPYPRVKAALTSWKSPLDVVGASMDEAVETHEKYYDYVVYAGTKSVSPIWFPRWSGYGCTCATIFAETRSDTHPRFRRGEAYVDSIATVVGGTRSASHARLQW